VEKKEERDNRRRPACAGPAASLVRKGKGGTWQAPPLKLVRARSRGRKGSSALSDVGGRGKGGEEKRRRHLTFGSALNRGFARDVARREEGKVHFAKAMEEETRGRRSVRKKKEGGKRRSASTATLTRRKLEKEGPGAWDRRSEGRGKERKRRERLPRRPLHPRTKGQKNLHLNYRRGKRGQGTRRSKKKEKVIWRMEREYLIPAG